MGLLAFGIFIGIIGYAVAPFAVLKGVFLIIAIACGVYLLYLWNKGKERIKAKEIEKKAYHEERGKLEAQAEMNKKKE